MFREALRRYDRLSLGVMAVRDRNYPDDGASRNSDWFAKQLGDGWQTSGDGIYEYVEEQPDAVERHGSPRVDDVAEPPLTRRSDEIKNHLGRPRAGGSGSSSFLSPTTELCFRRRSWLV